MSYVPISCEFHDLLEIRAMTGRSTLLRHRDGAGLERTRDVVIKDVYARGGAEYLALDSGETLRLDQLVAVDGVQLRACA